MMFVIRFSFSYMQSKLNFRFLVIILYISYRISKSTFQYDSMTSDIHRNTNTK